MTEVPSEDASSGYSWYVVVVLMLANVSGFIDRQILVLLTEPIMRDLKLSLTQMGVLIGLPFAIFFTLMGVPIARLADSTNRRNVIAAGIGLWSVMTALCGLVGSFGRLLLARIGVGVGEASLQAPATSLIADYFARERLGTAMGVYSMGIFIGSGLAYFIGGWIVGLVSAQQLWSWPIVGAIRPWQTVFIVVGLPGLLIALLLLTIREPARRERRTGPVRFGELLNYLRLNLRTFLCLGFGFAMSATVNFGIAAWLATFLVQSHEWSAARAGMTQGVLTMAIGTIGVVVGGRVADAYARRGNSDGALRVGMIGAGGMLVSATAYPFAGSANAAVAWLVLVNFFAAFPWGAASAAAAQIFPAAMRAQGAALYFSIVNLVSVALGPVAVAAIAQYVFGDKTAIRQGLVIVNIVCMTIAFVLFMVGMPAYRNTIARRDAQNSS